jgi:hypothetical protein
MEKPRIRCCDGCGDSVADMSEAQAKAWRHLQITGRYRCPKCVKELEAANTKDTNEQPVP